MKALLIALVIIFSVGMASAEQKFVPAVPCPKTTMVSGCMECHVKGNFKVKETRPDAHLIYPNRNMKIIGWGTDKPRGFFFLTDIDADAIKEFFDYLADKKINRVIIEIHSPGGGLFAAQRIISLIQQFQLAGGEVETRVNGFAASAGFLIFCAGDKGHRFVGPESSLMWHELMTFKMFAIETPSDQEEQSRILRGLQDIRNSWLSTRGNLTKEQIDEKIRKKEFWMSGKQAVDLGFASGFIGR